MQSSSLSRSPPILLSRDEPRCGPPATYNARRQEKPALPAAPFVALQISHHLPQPPTLLLSPPSLPSVRTLRLSLLHSQLPWVASPQPLERSLPTPGAPQHCSNLKRALWRGILWCSQASPTTVALSDHITVQGERRTAPPVTVRGRPTAPVSASAADTCGSCPRYEAGGATPCSVLRAQNS